MAETTVLKIAAIVAIGVVAQWLAWRIALPSILLLLLSGFLVGPVTGFLDPDALLGDLLLPLVSISVALILYEGGLSLKIAELTEVGGAVRNLVSVGALLTWVVSALASHWIFGLDAALAILLGAVLVVTGPTVIGPMLRHIRPKGRVGAVLRWEGIVIDPLGAMLAVLVFEAILIGEAKGASAQIAIAILKTVVLGGGLGVAAAGLLTIALRRYWIPDFLQNGVSLTLVVAVFVASNALQPESGLLAATVMGIALANQKFVDVRHIVEFKENLRLLLISTLFILLAARLRLDDMATIAWGAAAFVAVLVLLARPLAVSIATLGSRLGRKERLFLAWVAPRGIVAAAVASVFALRLEQVGYESAHLLVPITFATILGTVAIYGLTSPLVARRLGVADANPQGVLFVGAHAWTRAVAATLKDKGLAVLLVDNNRENAAAVRMAGLPIYTGSILAEYALDEIDLSGIGRLLAVTPNDWVNVLAVQRFTRIFGREECYQLPSREEAKAGKSPHRHLHGRWLFGEKVSDALLEQRLASGAVIKATRLSESFDYAAFRQMYGESAVPMFIIAEDGTLDVIAADEKTEPRAGQTLISLVHEPKDPTTSERTSTASATEKRKQS